MNTMTARRMKTPASDTTITIVTAVMPKKKGKIHEDIVMDRNRIIQMYRNLHADVQFNHIGIGLGTLSTVAVSCG